MSVYENIVYIITFQNYITLEQAFYFYSILFIIACSIGWVIRKIRGFRK